MNNTKLLVIFCFLIIFSGLAFIWFGIKTAEITLQPTPLPTIFNTPLPTSSGALGIEGQKVLVTEVVDGDTIEIEGGQRIRLIGIDTPETKDPRRPVGCFGKEASNKVKELLSGREVYLEKDVSEVDKYKRLLRYVYLRLEDGNMLFVNDYLVREGFAKVLTYPPDVKYNEQLRVAERQAREQKRGLWKKC